MLIARATLLLIAITTTVACSKTTGPQVSDGPARIRYAGMDAVITIPDTVAPGVSFTASIRTFGGGCTREAARTDLDRGNGTEIRPYNRTANGHVCTDDILFIEHQVVLKFDTVNDYVVRFLGINEGYETNWKQVEWVRDRIVKVR